MAQKEKARSLTSPMTSSRNLTDPNKALRQYAPKSECDIKGELLEPRSESMRYATCDACGAALELNYIIELQKEAGPQPDEVVMAWRTRFCADCWYLGGASLHSVLSRHNLMIPPPQWDSSRRWCVVSRITEVGSKFPSSYNKFLLSSESHRLCEYSPGSKRRSAKDLENYRTPLVPKISHYQKGVNDGSEEG